MEIITLIVPRSITQVSTCELRAAAKMWQAGRAIAMTPEPPSPSHDPIRRNLALLGTALFLILAPGCVAGLVPWWISQWQFRAPFAGYAPLRVIGVVLIAAGACVVVDSFARFALQGLGTPAPVFPTLHLVIKGFYRYVRNPMYVAVVAVILGQALLFGDIRVFEYALFAWLVAHLFVRTYEEPRLRKSFGAEYDRFRANVPRWIPRLTPWRDNTESRHA
jgi:protein-S-isoprenylcysteine O-methyltransferase Ste14